MSTPSRAADQRGHRSPPGTQETAGLLVSGIITALTLALAFGLLALGVESFWMVFVVGFGVVLPMAMGVVAHVWSEEDSDPAENDTRTPVEQLKMRYARGELTDEEFERRVERLVSRGERD